MKAERKREKEEYIYRVHDRELERESARAVEENLEKHTLYMFQIHFHFLLTVCYLLSLYQLMFKMHTDC